MPHAGCDNGCNELLLSLDWLIKKNLEELTVYWYLLSTILLSFCGLIAFVYFARQGQFDDIEDIKYQMFRDEEENR